MNGKKVVVTIANPEISSLKFEKPKKGWKKVVRNLLKESPQMNSAALLEHLKAKRISK